jgi:hypothetical protein
MEEIKNRISSILFFFGLAYAFFHIVPAFLPALFKKPLTWGDTLDFFTPLAVVSLAFFLYSQIKKALQSQGSLETSHKTARKLAKALLGLGFLLYIDGHGLHLAANSLARLFQNEVGSEFYNAAYLLDEIISHYIMNGGMILISAGLIFFALDLSFKSLSGKSFFLLSFGAVFYGFNFTVNCIEGQTVALGISASGLGFLLTSYFYYKNRKNSPNNSIHLFYLSAYFLSLILFAYWRITQSGFPQFSELGWI